MSEKFSDNITKIVVDYATRLQETEEEFIYQSISPFCCIIYETQPRKGKTYWYLTYDRYSCLNRYYNVNFPMVKWSDEEPWLIEDLKKMEVVENYE